MDKRHTGSSAARTAAPAASASCSSSAAALRLSQTAQTVFWDPFSTSSKHVSPVPAYTSSQLERISGGTTEATDDRSGDEHHELKQLQPTTAAGSETQGTADAASASFATADVAATSSSCAAALSSAEWPAAKRSRVGAAGAAAAAAAAPLPLPVASPSDADDSDEDENICITLLAKRTTSPPLATVSAAAASAPAHAATAAQDVIDLTAAEASPPPPALLPKPCTAPVQTPWTKSLPPTARSQPQPAPRVVAAASALKHSPHATAASAAAAAGISTFATAASLVAAAASASSPRFENIPPQQPPQSGAATASLTRPTGPASSSCKRARDEGPAAVPLAPAPSPPSRFLQEDDALDADEYDKLFEATRAATATATTSASHSACTQPPPSVTVAPSQPLPVASTPSAPVQTISPHFPFAAAAASAAVAAARSSLPPPRPLPPFTPQPSATLLGHCGIAPSTLSAMLSASSNALQSSELRSPRVPPPPLQPQQYQLSPWTRMPPVMPWCNRGGGGGREAPSLLKGRSRQDDLSTAPQSTTMVVDSPLMQFLAQR